MAFPSKSNLRESTVVDGFQQLHRNGDGNELGRSSWYLVRCADGTYDYQRNWDENDPHIGAPYGVRGYRSIRSSPNPEESDSFWYFCGFGKTGAGDTGPAAWICKGTVPQPIKDPP